MCLGAAWALAYTAGHANDNAKSETANLAGLRANVAAGGLRQRDALGVVVAVGQTVGRIAQQALRADGLGTADHSALACYYEKLAKVEVTR